MVHAFYDNKIITIALEIFIFFQYQEIKNSIII